MKPKHFIYLALAFCSITNSYAQDSTTIFIPAGTSMMEKLPPSKQFKYHEFRQGKVAFKEGSVVTAALNYSYLTGEIEFIGPANDTLTLSDDKLPLLKEIVIDSTIFYYNTDYFEQIASHPETGRLLKKELWSETSREKLGAYGAPASSVQTYSSARNRVHSVVDGGAVTENIYLKITVDYFIENKNNEIAQLTKKNLLKLYSSKKKIINDYLDKNPVDFRREDDLKRLFFAINN